MTSSTAPTAGQTDLNTEVDSPRIVRHVYSAKCGQMGDISTADTRRYLAIVSWFIGCGQMKKQV